MTPRPALPKREAKKLLTMIRWYQKNLGVEDWKIELHLADKPPKWASGDESNVLAQIADDRETKEATVWIAPKRCQKHRTDIRSVLLHELVHLSLTDLGIPNDNDHPDIHFFINKLEALLLKAYKRSGKIGKFFQPKPEKE